MLSWLIAAPPFPAQSSRGPSPSEPSQWFTRPARYAMPRVSRLELSPLPTAVPCARLHTRNVLTEWGLPRDMVKDAEVVVSELISNAVQAMMSLPESQPIALRLYANAERLIIESWDRHPEDPVRRPAPPDAEGGRGLAVIEAYSNRWGCLRVTTRLKAVWSEFLLPAHSLA